MPVDFLSSEQEQRYWRFASEPSPAQLLRYFVLSATDRELVDARRGDHNRLGFAVQLGTVRFLGTFLPDAINVPASVVSFVATQIDVAPTDLAGYSAREPTHREHAGEIQRRYGYRDFTDPREHFALVRWLYARAWVSAERPSVLFDLATARLVERKVLLPGVSVLTRLVAQVRDRTALRLWRTLAAAPNAAQRTRLEGLLELADGARYSTLDRLRRAPISASAAGLVAGLDRVRDIRGLGVSDIDVAAIPAGRMAALARHAVAARAQAVARMGDERRVATLLAFALRLEITAVDDALDVLDVLVGTLLARVERVGQRERLRSLPVLDTAARRLREACMVLLSTDYTDAALLRAAVYARVSPAELTAAVDAVGALTRPPDDHHYDDLLSRYALVRRFLPALLQTIEFDATAAGQPVVSAVRSLRDLEGRKRVRVDDVQLEVVTSAWRPLVVLPDGEVDRRAYTFCVLDRLRDALHHHDVFVARSERWGDPLAKLLSGPAWESARPLICRTLDHQPTPDAELTALSAELDAAYRQTVGRLPDNSAVRIEEDGGRPTVVLTALDRLEEPASLTALRDQVEKLMPRVDLPELLLEVSTWTRFTEEFTHVSEGAMRVEDLATSVCAVLVSEACNIGLEPLVRPQIPAQTRGRLSWVAQNYLRAETLTRANARLVDHQAGLELAQVWGGGEVASCDGLRFVVPVRTINAGPNPRYFGVGSGVTYINYTSDQFTGFHAIVVPGTLRDSLFILDGLLEQETSLQPTELMSDTAGYSDIVFGLFRLLGYQFSPRLADLGEARLWRIDRNAFYGPLDAVGRHRINVDLISGNWDDLLRVAGSLKSGTVRASELLRALHGGGRPSTIARAISELGRVAKTLYLLAYLDDAGYRRRILTQLNRGEARHSLARAVFHGQRGELRQRYREGQEDQLSALGLVVNAIVLWNTIYLGAVLTQLRSDGVVVAAEDVERLSPLGFGHINMLGRYQFTLAEPILRGELRELRDPTQDADLLAV